MVIDFHTHTKLSKKVPFRLSYFHRMIRSARRNGLTSLALTEHFNTVNFADIYDMLDRHFAYKDHYYDVDGFRVFAGMEIDVKETGHVLLIGHRDDIRAIHRHLAAYTVSFQQFDQLFDAAEQYNVIKIGAHPTRKSTPLEHLSDAQLSRFDFFDLNGKDLAKQADTRERVYELARRHNKPVVAGSDSHLPVQFGCVRNRLADDCRTVDELRDCIVGRRYEVTVSPHVKWKVLSAGVLKKIVKTVTSV